VEALTFQTQILLLVGDCYIGKLVLYQKDFGWMAFLGVQPRSVGVTLAEGLYDLDGGRGEPLRLKIFMIDEAGRGKA
jgi:hypothetical protein